MIKISYKIIGAVLLVVLCTVFIFSNSLKDIDKSINNSDPIVDIVENIINRGNEDEEQRVDLEYIVRKGAHFIEFFVLGVCVTLLYFTVPKKHHYAILFAFLYVVAVAFLDEFIQKFTGRGSCLTDVLIDSLGASIGILLTVLFGAVISNRRICKCKISK